MQVAETLLYAASTVFQLVAVIFILLQMRERRGQRSLQFLFAALMVMLAYRLYALTGVRGPATAGSVFQGSVGLIVSILLFCSLFSIRAAARSAVISEQLYRTIGESTDYGVWVCDATGKNTYVSPSFLKLLGLTQEQCSAMGWADALHPDESEPTIAAWKDCVRSGENWYREHRFKGIDGKWHPILACGMPVRNYKGEIVQWAGINLDIRRLKEAEEHERDARQLAERQSRMKDEFLATVSHELRTPLNAILGWTQLLQQGGVKPTDMQHAFDVIYRNSRAQVRLIEDLLDMSRIISGKVRLDVHSLMPNTVIEAAIESVVASADARDIRIRKVLDTTAGPVTGDPNRLQQAVWNILVNAIKFTPKGGRIEVLLERVNSHVEIIVTDNGEGINAEFLPYIFDRFRQADSSISRQHAGLGIGLALVKNLVELHGGTVSAKSEGVGRGATFTITLPLRATETVTTGRTHPTMESQSPLPISRKQLQGVKLLIIDDDADARELIGRLMADCDATVTLAASAGEAKSILQEEKFDLILCDIGMPGEDGLEFMQSIRRSGIRTPAVALTAFARSEDRLRALQAGFQIHLAKPVEPAEVVAVVESLSGRLRPQSI